MINMISKELSRKFRERSHPCDYYYWDKSFTAEDHAKVIFLWNVWPRVAVLTQRSATLQCIQCTGPAIVTCQGTDCVSLGQHWNCTCYMICALHCANRLHICHNSEWDFLHEGPNWFLICLSECTLIICSFPFLLKGSLKQKIFI